MSNFHFETVLRHEQDKLWSQKDDTELATRRKHFLHKVAELGSTWFKPVHTKTHEAEHAILPRLKRNLEAHITNGDKDMTHRTKRAIESVERNIENEKQEWIDSYGYDKPDHEFLEADELGDFEEPDRFFCSPDLLKKAFVETQIDEAVRGIRFADWTTTEGSLLQHTIVTAAKLANEQAQETNSRSYELLASKLIWTIMPRIENEREKVEERFTNNELIRFCEDLVDLRRRYGYAKNSFGSYDKVGKIKQDAFALYKKYGLRRTGATSKSTLEELL